MTLENGPRILIVDDERAYLNILVEALSREYQISVAKDGPRALKIASSANPPDLILLDINMPGMDGYEVCRRLKTDEKTMSIPVIFITAMDEEEDETQGLELGAVDYVTKPISIPIVYARIRTHLELKRKTDMLEKLSFQDGLTNLYNRRHFDLTLEKEWRSAKREPSLLSLLMMDIDYFKAFNDHYGHGAGDRCLERVSAALQSVILRPRDTVARYGGEEFAAMLPDTDHTGASHLAESVRASVAELAIPHAYSKVADRITISVGAATVRPTAASTSEVLVESADEALYQAKRQSRNGVVSIDLS